MTAQEAKDYLLFYNNIRIKIIKYYETLNLDIENIYYLIWHATKENKYWISLKNLSKETEKELRDNGFKVEVESHPCSEFIDYIIKWD